MTAIEKRKNENGLAAHTFHSHAPPSPIPITINWTMGDMREWRAISLRVLEAVRLAGFIADIAVSNNLAGRNLELS